jgi:acetyl esterase/lipase
MQWQVRFSMAEPTILYTQEPPGPTSFLMKRLAEKNAALMRGLTIAEQREAKDVLADVRIIMPGVMAEELSCAGVPCLWIQLKEGCHTDKVILYIHGGSWAFGNLHTAKPFGVFLAEETRCKVLVAEYRLSPEHPYPAGLDDCFAVYQWLLTCGYKPEDIALFGDSAGGDLSLCLMHRLKALGHQLPACFGGASPVTDARRESAIVKSDVDLIHVLHEGREQDIFTLYLGEERDRDDPQISPICGDLTGFPPLLIHTGAEEPLVADNAAFVEKAHAQGVDAQLVVYSGMFHDFTIVGRTLKESRHSVAGFTRFLRGHLLGEALADPATEPLLPRHRSRQPWQGFLSPGRRE